MQIDPSLIPSTLDAYHLAMAGLILVLLILQIILLTAGIAALLRRRKTGPMSVVIERVPAQLIPAPSAAPISVIIEKVPAEMLAAAAPREAAKPAELTKAERIEAPVVKQATPDAALQLLGLMQKEARFIDFVRENVAGYSDAEIGAAARVVHEGCRKVLNQHFELSPVRAEQENSRVTLPKGFDAAEVRITGNIVGQPPFSGTLIHRGWRATAVKLPKVAEGHDVQIIAQAEVEL